MRRDKTFTKFSNNQLFQHLLFWGVILSIASYHYFREYGLVNAILLDLLLVSVSAMVVYSNLSWFIPEYLSRRKYGTYFSFLLPTLVTAGFIFSAMLSLIGDLSQIDEWENYFSFRGWFTSTIFITMIVMITTMLKFTKEWFVQQRETAELEKGKLKSELNFLKNQLNPEFLFSTLDELETLAGNRSDEAPDMVLKLSEVLRYILYDGNKSSVPLERELNFIKTYIDLERQRWKDSVEVDLNIKGTTDTKKIYPLIVLPYVSETFKHLSEDGTTRHLDFEFDVTEDRLNIQVEPFLEHSNNKNNGTLEIVEKANQRLELLYPNKHQVDMIPGKEHVSLDLTIQLTD